MIPAESPPAGARNRATPSFDVTDDNRELADVVVAIYLEGAGYGKRVDLKTMARLAGVPISDLLGAMRRRVHTEEPDVVDVRS